MSGDKEMLGHLLPKLEGIIQAHVEGTRFHIGVDPNDGLLRQGAEGYQLTWMDAKVDGWVVTPRRGKAVEINALWYNALCLMEGWCRIQGEHSKADQYGQRARQCAESFNRRYWNPERECLFDVVDGEKGDDPAIRPNQVIAISLPNPVLSRERWQPVLDCVKRDLLTPVGLRSLSRDHPDYKARYFGDLRTRDAAYHQGTVWAWLIGPFVDAWIKVYPDKSLEGCRFLKGLVQHLDHAGVGSVSEIFDAEPPFAPRGCIAQAWSVAELLRCWLKCYA